MAYEEKVLTLNGKVIFNKVIFPAFKRGLKPFYENEACFMFVNRGEFSIRSAETKFDLTAGDGMLAKCVDFFVESSAAQRERADDMELIGVYIYPEIIEELFKFDLSLSTHVVDYNVKQIPVQGLLKLFREGISILIDNPKLADDAIIKNKLKEFILLIIKSEGITNDLDFLSGMFRSNDTSFKSAILNNIFSNLSLEEFSQLCGLSLSSFQRKFQKEFQISPKKYISEKRLEKASGLLKESQDRISDIAYDCGFETISTFNRSFKALYHLSPSNYRVKFSA
tara:strand:+ start:334 stop:1179 length:846 start_codon:yes stop_codon:yes gene_type:complete